jgi:hypothetical protein
LVLILLKKRFLITTLTFQEHRNSKFISKNIAEYLFQYGKNCTRKNLQYTAQENKDFEDLKILETLKIRKSVFPSSVWTPRCQSLDAQHQEQKSCEVPNGSADTSHREQKSYESPDGLADASHKEHLST